MLVYTSSAYKYERVGHTANYGETFKYLTWDPHKNSKYILLKHCFENFKISFVSFQLPYAQASHGPRGSQVDHRTMLSATASRLLHTRHPRKMTGLTTLNTLDNTVNMVSGRQQARSNKMGDTFSKKESHTILNSVTRDYDAPVLALKAGVEFLYTGPGMLGAGTRLRKSTAIRLGIHGYQYFGDNVGRVGKCIFVLFSNIFPQSRVSRFNKGLDNSNSYLQQTMLVIGENRLSTAHLR